MYQKIFPLKLWERRLDFRLKLYAIKAHFVHCLASSLIVLAQSLTVCKLCHEVLYTSTHPTTCVDKFVYHVVLPLYLCASITVILLCIMLISRDY